MVPPKVIHLPNRAGLTAEQIKMYSQERLMNFRLISRIMATYSPYVLSRKDLASADLSLELTEIGQFAEVASSSLHTRFIFDNLDWLLDVDFPFEGYTALRESILIGAARGRLAKLDTFVAYRPTTKQLVASISGTSSLAQSFQDIRTLKIRHPHGHGCAVHTGFWKMYEGVREKLIALVKKGLNEHEVDELVITGHSMGGALSHLLAIDLLTPGGLDLPKGLPIKIVVFGAPRCGNAALVELWLSLTKDYREKYGVDSIKELSVKAYRDGVPALPPKLWGFRHFVQHPLYLEQGRLYNIPNSEIEFSLFHISEEEDEKVAGWPYPRGGHNYYMRDMEKTHRRNWWLDDLMKSEDEWRDRYLEKVARMERGVKAKKHGLEQGEIEKPRTQEK